MASATHYPFLAWVLSSFTRRLSDFWRRLRRRRISLSRSLCISPHLLPLASREARVTNRCRALDNSRNQGSLTGDAPVKNEPLDIVAQRFFCYTGLCLGASPADLR